MNRAIAPCHEQSKFLLAARVRRRRVAGPYNRGDHSILYLPLVLPLDLLANLIHCVHSDTDRHFRESTLRSLLLLGNIPVQKVGKGSTSSPISEYPLQTTVAEYHQGYGAQPCNEGNETYMLPAGSTVLRTEIRWSFRLFSWSMRKAKAFAARFVKIRYDCPHQDCAPGRSAVSSAVERRSFRKCNRGD